MLKNHSTIKTKKENKKFVERRLKDFKIKKFLIDEDEDRVLFVFLENEDASIVKTITNELGGTFTRR